MKIKESEEKFSAKIYKLPLAVERLSKYTIKEPTK
jgi:hypothetical protein